MAGGRGFEPRLTESESAVLPLNYPPPDLLKALGRWLSGHVRRCALLVNGREIGCFAGRVNVRPPTDRPMRTPPPRRLARTAAAHASITLPLGPGRQWRRSLSALRHTKGPHGRATPKKRPRNPVVRWRGRPRKLPGRQAASQARRLWRRQPPATSRGPFALLLSLALQVRAVGRRWPEGG